MQSDQSNSVPLNYKIGNERLIKVTQNASRKLVGALEYDEFWPKAGESYPRPSE